MRNSNIRIIRLHWDGLSYDPNLKSSLHKSGNKKIDLESLFVESLRPSPTLNSLIGSQKLKTFASKHLSKKPYFNKKSDNKHNIMSIEDLLRGLKEGSFNSKRVHFYSKDGDPMPMSDYEIRRYNAELHIEDGGSLSIRELQWAIPNIREMAHDLQYSFGCNFNVNAYLTPPKTQTFSLHWDDHDTFALQLEGSKTWTAYCPKEILPVESYVFDRNFSDKKLDKIGSYKLDVGSFLYLPRGHIHKAVAQNNYSLHITFGLHSIMLSHFLKTIDSVFTKHILNNDLLRKDISSRSLMGNPKLIDELVRHLPKNIQHLDLVHFMTQYIDEYWENFHISKRKLREGDQISLSAIPYQWIGDDSFTGLKNRTHAVLIEKINEKNFKKLILDLSSGEITYSKKINRLGRIFINALYEANFIFKIGNQ